MVCILEIELLVFADGLNVRLRRENKIGALMYPLEK